MCMATDLLLEDTLNLSSQRSILIFIAYLFLFGSTALSQPLYVERYTTEHLDLEYLWLQDNLSSAPQAYFPATTSKVARYLEKVRIHGARTSYAAYLLNSYGSSVLPNAEHSPTQSGRFIGWAIGDIMRQESFSDKLFTHGDHLFTTVDTTRGTEFGLDLVQRYDLLIDNRFKDSGFLVQTWGIESWLNLGEHWGAWVRFMDSVERGAGNHTTIYSPYAAYVVKSPESISFDETHTYIGYDNGVVAVRIGRGKHTWGPSHWNHLLLGNQHAAYPYAELQIDINDHIRFIAFHGDLNPGNSSLDTLYITPEGNDRRVFERKYISAHRLEVNPVNWLSFGFNEAVIYGEREREWGYLVPYNLFWSEGHVQRMDDNVIWNMDIRLRPFRNTMLYGEFLLDEANLTALGSEDFANRTGYTIGGRFIGIPRSDIRAEYTRIRPFVFTHWYLINIPTNWGEPLSTLLPPNSDEWHLSWRYIIHNRLTVELFASARRHGATPEGAQPVGGDIRETRDGNEGIYPFLDGRRQDSRELGGEIRWQALERFYFSLYAAQGTDAGQEYHKYALRGAYNFWLDSPAD